MRLGGGGGRRSQSWARRRERRMGARKLEARQNTSGLKFPPIWKRGCCASSPSTLACPGIAIDGPRRLPPRSVDKASSASTSDRNRRSRFVETECAPCLTVVRWWMRHIASRRGRGWAERFEVLGHASVGMGERSDPISAMGGNPRPGVCCLAADFRDPFDAHACVPRTSKRSPHPRPPAHSPPAAGGGEALPFPSPAHSPPAAENAVGNREASPNPVSPRPAGGTASALPAR